MQFQDSLFPKKLDSSSQTGTAIGYSGNIRYTITDLAVAIERGDKSFFDRLYEQRLIDYAKSSVEFEIPIHNKRGNGWKTKVFTRKKITRQEQLDAEAIIEEHNKIPEELVEQKADKLLEAYRYLATHYLAGITEDEFARSDWGEMKPIMDACNFRTLHSLAFVSKGLHSLFYFGKAQLTAEEMEVYRMYRLWKDWNTKPWEYNGGFVYMEDINAVLKLEEFYVDNATREHKKSEVKSRMKGGRR